MRSPATKWILFEVEVPEHRLDVREVVGDVDVGVEPVAACGSEHPATNRRAFALVLRIFEVSAVEALRDSARLPAIIASVVDQNHLMLDPDRAQIFEEQRNVTAGSVGAPVTW